MVNGRCAACKYLRRRCPSDCVFAPYFPSNNPQRFDSVHRIYGASNVAKMLELKPPRLYVMRLKVEYTILCMAALRLFSNYSSKYITRTESELAKTRAEIAVIRSNGKGKEPEVQPSTDQVHDGFSACPQSTMMRDSLPPEMASLDVVQNMVNNEAMVVFPQPVVPYSYAQAAAGTSNGQAAQSEPPFSTWTAVSRWRGSSAGKVFAGRGAGCSTMGSRTLRINEEGNNQPRDMRAVNRNGSVIGLFDREIDQFQGANEEINLDLDLAANHNGMLLDRNNSEGTEEDQFVENALKDPSYDL
ncbi:LOB domain-containing protein 27-like [Rosa sericea]